MAREQYKIGLFDYFLVAIILIISIAIGIYHGFRTQIRRFFKIDQKRVGVEDPGDDDINLDELSPDEEQTTKLDEYLTAKSSMGTLPISFSLMASFFSATGIVGVPTEVYQFGIQFWIVSFAYATPPFLGAYVFGPFFSRLKVKSVFEYLQMRFEDDKVKLASTCCYIIRNFISLAILTYGPATSVSLIMNISPNLTIILLGLIASIYTAIGGLKAVVWTDLFQSSIMILNVLVIVVKGIYDLGGFSNFWRINQEGGRLDNLFDFNPDPFVRQTFWSLFIGGTFFFIPCYCFDQQTITRYQAAKSEKKAKRAVLFNSPIIIFYYTLLALAGLVIYARYAKCDPKEMGYIKTSDQLSTFYVMDNMPMIIGLFLGGILCSSLSSMSSFLNSMAFLIWQDLLSRFDYFSSMKESQKLTINKILVFICGSIGTLLCFLISSLKLNLIVLNILLNGAFSSPLTGLFLLSMFFGITNKPGAIIGVMTGLVMTIWVAMGGFIVKPAYPRLDVSIEACFNESIYANTTHSGVINYDHLVTNYTGIKRFYSLSYMYYTAFGILCSVIAGVIASLLTGGRKNKTKPSLLVFDLTSFLNK